MALDFFDRGSLEQVTGEIPPRWGQDSSELFDASGSVDNTTTTLRTVSANKKYYVDTMIIVQQNNPGSSTANQVTIKDGSTVKMIVNSTGGETIIPPISAPFSFSDSVVLDATGANGGTWTLTVVGWEE